MRGSLFYIYHDPRSEAVAKLKHALAKCGKKAGSHYWLPDWTRHSIITLEELLRALSELFNTGMVGITTNSLTAQASVANVLPMEMSGAIVEED